MEKERESERTIESVNFNELIGDQLRSMTPKESDRIFKKVREYRKMTHDTLKSLVKAIVKKEHKVMVKREIKTIDGIIDTEKGKESLMYLLVKHESFKKQMKELKKSDPN